MKILQRNSRAARLTIAAGMLLVAQSSAQEIGFLPEETRAISVAACELAGSILKCVGEGEIIIERVGTPPRVGIQVTVRGRTPASPETDDSKNEFLTRVGLPQMELSNVGTLMDDLEIDRPSGCAVQVVTRKWIAGDSGK